VENGNPSSKATAKSRERPVTQTSSGQEEKPCRQLKQGTRKGTACVEKMFTKGNKSQTAMAKTNCYEKNSPSQKSKAKNGWNAERIPAQEGKNICAHGGG